MLRLYNTAFYGSNSWDFSSEEVKKFGKTWNVNLRILFDLPFDSHCWIVEDLSDGRHLLQMIYSRFLKFVRSVALNKRIEVRALYQICKDDIRSATGSNIRTVLLQTGSDPMQLRVHLLKNWRVHTPEDTWTVPLIRNLIEVRGDNWEINFDDETSITAQDDELEFMLRNICTR